MIGSTLVTAQTGEDRQARAARADRAGQPDRPRVLPGHDRRPRLAEDRRDRLRGGRRRDRAGRRASAPTRSTPSTSTPASGCWTSSAARSRRRSASASRAASFTRLLKRIYRLFRDKDCLLLEINPFIVTEDGDLVALDCKMQFDDNSLYRQSAVAELRDFDEEDPKEVDAVRPRPQLRRARRERRLHRERRGPRDGHDGRDRPPRRAAGELPRRRRRREPGEDRERVPDRAHRPERARDPREHLRGDQPVRLDRAGRRAGGEGPADRRAR